jgi:hypothetical protein
MVEEKQCVKVRLVLKMMCAAAKEVERPTEDLNIA